MKKTFLVFAVMTGLTAAGQNKDLLDIQKLIKERQAKEKNVTERIDLVSPLLPTGITGIQREAYLLPNGDRVIYGNIDGMPIVQPDMRIFNLMPNTGSNIILPRTMPNAGRGTLSTDLGGPNHIMDQLAPSPVLEKLLKNKGR